LTKEYQIRLDPDKLVSYGLSIAQVEQQLSNNNTNAGGSFIVAGAQQIWQRFGTKWAIWTLQAKSLLPASISYPNTKNSGPLLGMTWYNLLSDRFTGLNAIPVPGTLRDSLVLLPVVLEQQTELKPTRIVTDTGPYSDVMFGLFLHLGYRFCPHTGPSKRKMTALESSWLIYFEPHSRNESQRGVMTWRNKVFQFHVSAA
jgi:Tn3 transposase DDE domain